jgi:hypothetical protein
VKEEAVLGQKAAWGSDECEEGRRGAGHFTDNKKLQRPAMARRYRTLRWRRVRKGEEMHGCARVQKGQGGARSRVYKERKREMERRPEAEMPLMAMAASWQSRRGKK